jgi:plasmid stabilization system protein ParE
MVIWSQPARADLKHIYDFVAEDSIFYARKVVQEINDKTDTLNALPGIGKMVLEIGRPNIKELSIYSYRILYEVKTNDAYILAIVHKRRDFKSEDLT